MLNFWASKPGVASPTPICAWVITADLFTLVHLGAYPSPPPSNIWWWQQKLKHARFPSGPYASYWNAVLFLHFCCVYRGDISRSLTSPPFTDKSWHLAIYNYAFCVALCWETLVNGNQTATWCITGAVLFAVLWNSLTSSTRKTRIQQSLEHYSSESRKKTNCWLI